MDASRFEELSGWLGERLAIDAECLAEHGRDPSHHPAAPPDAVAYPETTEEVARIVRWCVEADTALVPCGAGTSVEGGTLAPTGGLAVDLSRMNRIKAVHLDDQDAVVEPGVTRVQLGEHLAAEPLFFSVDPGADASIGGMASTGASGTNTVRYGTIRDNVLALEVVLGDGRVIRTGSRARKSSSGYDLTHLFLGAEGTLGVITELTVRLHPRPPAVSVVVGTFEAIGPAVRTVMEVVQRAIPVARAELLDGVAIDAVNRYSGMDHAVAPTLFFEFHGSPAAVEEQASEVESIARGHGGARFRHSLDPAESERLWQARKDAYYAARALRPEAHAVSTDVCVPISRLAECIEETVADIERTAIRAPIVGHVGDGNFHCIVLANIDDSQEIAAVDAFHHRLIERALACGGTSSGEHGVGLGKREFMLKEHGEGVAVMRELKRALDPHGILNPGKLFLD
ncbi:MAG: FAD-binding protein [Acidobacteria bacterium]|nr:FAD-binding protein [Acidobacteriota bacterium]NIM60680.1 FAD-binding protein [Acidobacteriota bacterium]NIO58640.1 FAD-binding protein [Acidobacteriota bacterium]NIQ29696.1 FAD-binding protein [Acidobacteriota bacterium]NIQ84413.1 FAD-binding protein [Acidobacteriota bacterium]